MSRILYTALLGLVVAQRLFELRRSNRNTTAALQRGAREYGAGHYPWMVAMHTAFLLACLAEVWFVGRPFVPVIGRPALALLIVAGVLRVWVLYTLGERWTTRIICWPASDPIVTGPYRYLRHPNYLAVIAEIIALPMVHTAWWTATIFTLLNAAVLRTRIRAEESALAETGSYRELLGQRHRLIPGARGTT